MTWIRCNGRSLSSAQFDEQARKAAAIFANCGVAAGDGVALLLRNDFSFFEASIGAGMLGAYSIPINWHATAAEADYVLRDCGAKVLVIHSDLAPAIRAAIPSGMVTIAVETDPAILQAYGAVDHPIAAGHRSWHELIAAAQPFVGEPAIAPSTIIYTSGTTGRPKGVRRPQRNEEQQRAFAQMLLISYGYTDYIDGPGKPDEIVTAVIGPAYHAAPNTHGTFSIRVGANVIIEPRFDPEQLLALIERERITHLNMVPIMFVRLLRLPDEVKRRYDLSSLRYVAHAAAPCSPAVKRAMIDWWGPVICEYYGTTELGNITWLNTEEWLGHPGSVGRAMPEAIVEIADAEGKLLPTGNVGEVLARRINSVDFTYHNDPGKRAAADRGGLLACGDVGYLDTDGFLYLVDRKSDMIVSGGANIYPAEIEAELMKLAGVADCAVFGIPDEEFGESVHAVVQTMPGAQPDTAAIRADLRKTLAGYKVPRTIDFTDEMPREDSGKLFKRKLRDKFWEEHERRI